MKKFSIVSVVSVLILSLVSPAVFADVFLGTNEDGRLTLTNEPEERKFKAIRKIIDRSEWPQGREVPSPEKIKKIVKNASDKYDIPGALIFSVLQVESAGDSRAHSEAGAKGLMQLMPATAEALGVDDIWNPRENIFGGTKYLSRLISRYNGDIQKTLAAYNAGPGNVAKFEGIPPFPETKQFVEIVQKRYQRLQKDAKKTESESSNIRIYRDKKGVLHVTNTD